MYDLGFKMYDFIILGFGINNSIDFFVWGLEFQLNKNEVGFILVKTKYLLIKNLLQR
jgi:hypothetical protein